MPPVRKDPRKEAVDRAYADYGREVREANFERDRRIRAALDARNKVLEQISLLGTVPPGMREAV